MHEIKIDLGTSDESAAPKMLTVRDLLKEETWDKKIQDRMKELINKKIRVLRQDFQEDDIKKKKMGWG